MQCKSYSVEIILTDGVQLMTFCLLLRHKKQIVVDLNSGMQRNNTLAAYNITLITKIYCLAIKESFLMKKLATLDCQEGQLYHLLPLMIIIKPKRSEERRVGKECRNRR